ncbi:MAG: XdhC family protein [Zetaproteobacteria bacterium]|nr:XdhC family protein [Zetaproteobacteria bacterium]NDK18697.1 XdhC family protein [Flavobacteriales bacterium]PJA04678.1 MAG: xanthine dehydrogenase [Flavobacteriales bacterium CG_4_10_14_0_2_um_filter_35_18]
MNFWNTLKEQLYKHQNLMLLLVVESLGSSPGRQGFKMLVMPNGDLKGSIGGGVMEFAMVEEAKNQLSQNKEQVFLKRQIHRGVKLEGSGMICSGEQTLAFIPLNGSHLPTIEKLMSNKRGTLSLTEKGLYYEKETFQNQLFFFKKLADKQWIYSERIQKKPKLYVIGGGHVGAATAILCQQIGFEVILFDNRLGLNTFEALPLSVEKHIIDYKKIADYIEEGAAVYVTIMTHGYKDDKIALAPLLNKNFKFLGVMGSKSKLNVLFEVLKSEGFTDDLLAKVYAPLGLFIKSETPEEIAISVAAQLIKIKNTN